MTNLLGLPDSTKKACVVCSTLLPITTEFFYQRKSGRYTGQFDSYCKECRKKCSRSRAKRSVRNTWLRRDYGITVEEYEAILADQGGVCRICSRPPVGKTALSVDHDHETKIVRGLLCDPCNRAIGMLGHDPNRIRIAARYCEEAHDILEPLRLFTNPEE